VGIYIWLVAANVTVMLTGLHSNPGFAMATGIGMGMGMEVEMGMEVGLGLLRVGATCSGAMQKRSTKLLHQHFVCAFCCCLSGRLSRYLQVCVLVSV